MAGTGELELRASDADRDRAIAALRDGFAEGRLSDATFLHRVEKALTARAGHELHGLVADLSGRRRRGAWLRAVRRGLARLRPPARVPVRPAALRLPTGLQTRYTIGRERWCDLILAHETVSRWHAVLERDTDGSWLLTDLGSTNGTRLNGWRVASPSRVCAGDLVEFGHALFVLADRPQ